MTLARTPHHSSHPSHGPRLEAQARATGDRGARDELIVTHLDVARRIALRVARRVPEWLGTDDLIAAATVGLAEAAERYDAGRGEPFVAFAEKRIRGAVLDELRRGDLLPRRVRARAREVAEARRVLLQRLGRAPEDREMAAELGVGLETYQEELAQLTNVAVVDLDPASGGLDALCAADEPTPAQSVERRQMLRLIRDGLDELPERDALILSLYYNERLPYAQIGDLLGVSESRVCQLHKRAITRLRGAIEEAGG